MTTMMLMMNSITMYTLCIMKRGIWNIPIQIKYCQASPFCCPVATDSSFRMDYVAISQ